MTVQVRSYSRKIHDANLRDENNWLIDADQANVAAEQGRGRQAYQRLKS